jgi:hypothetical protein
MTNVIAFGCWAPDEATFRASWITAGILLDEPGYVFSPQYPGIELTATQGWSGVITYPTGEVDQDGRPIMEAIAGWHCNVRVTGPLVAEMTYGLPQTDAEGALLSIFDRTWATNIFTLTEQPADPETGFPAGYRNSTGVTYCDMRDISTPANVRQ